MVPENQPFKGTFGDIRPTTGPSLLVPIERSLCSSSNHFDYEDRRYTLILIIMGNEKLYSIMRGERCHLHEEEISQMGMGAMLPNSEGEFASLEVGRSRK